MFKKEMAARPGTIATTSDNKPTDVNATPTKISTILDLFLRGKTLNRFEAERHHDHCLHSTVSSIQEWGLIVDREWERVPCLGGRATVRCKRYWLRQTPDNVASARALLTVWRRS
jgi:hypothetical protein